MGDTVATVDIHTAVLPTVGGLWEITTCRSTVQQCYRQSEAVGDSYDYEYIRNTVN